LNAAALLEAGLAKLHPSFDGSRAPDLVAAQSKARSAKLGLWQHEPEEEEPKEEDDADSSATSSATRQHVDVVVTDVVDANAFYVQLTSEPRVDWIAEQLASMALDGPPASGTQLQQGTMRPGDKCIAKFAGDGKWYRAKVEKANLTDPVRR
jgi:hypothetical protein